MLTMIAKRNRSNETRRPSSTVLGTNTPHPSIAALEQDPIKMGEVQKQNLSDPIRNSYVQIPEDDGG